jgi:hypothetical protein
MVTYGIRVCNNINIGNIVIRCRKFLINHLPAFWIWKVLSTGIQLRFLVSWSWVGDKNKCRLRILPIKKVQVLQCFAFFNLQLESPPIWINAVLSFMPNCFPKCKQITQSTGAASNYRVPTLFSSYFNELKLDCFENDEKWTRFSTSCAEYG